MTRFTTSTPLNIWIDLPGQQPNLLAHGRVRCAAKPEGGVEISLEDLAGLLTTTAAQIAPSEGEAEESAK